MYRLEHIRTIHLEMTSKCNASCPMCLRNVLGGGVNPQLPVTELTLEDVQTILPPQVIQRLETLYMCGNYGDPMMGQYTLESFAYLREHNANLRLQMFTNGSGRSEEWWVRLADLGVRVRFSVDGIGDTNAIYRRGTKWPLVLRAMKSYLNAGGIAEWDYIVFKHNEHQIEEARTLAAEMGFKSFNVKKTARFFSNVQVAVKTRQEVMNSNGEIEYYLEQPENGQYRNHALKREDEIIERFGSLKNFFGQTPIDCKASKESSIYISAEGLVFPCCWTANQLYPWYYEKRSAPVWKMIDALPDGLGSLNAKLRPLEQILSGPFFQQSVPNSWNIKGFENGRLFVCGKTCGRGFDAFSAQFQSGRPTDNPTPAPELR